MLTHSLSSLLNFSLDHELWSLLQASCKYEPCLQAKEGKIPTFYKTNRRREEETGRNWQGRRSWAWWHCTIPDTWEAEAGPHHWGQGLGSKVSSSLGWWLSQTLGSWGCSCECAWSPGFHLQHIKRSGSNWSGQRQLGSVLINTQTSFSFHAWDSFAQTGSTTLSCSGKGPKAELAPCCSPLCLCLTDSGRTVYFSEKGSVSQRLLEK